MSRAPRPRGGTGGPHAQSRPVQIIHAAVRGTVAAMAMTGMRSLTVSLGIMEQSPPDAIAQERASGLLRRVPPSRRRAAVELAHWFYGAGGGAAFGALPGGIRNRPWAGPLYGFAIWIGFELAVAPVLGLKQAKAPRPVERAALAVDHVLYGFVLSETRRRPQE